MPNTVLFCKKSDNQSPIKEKKSMGTIIFLIKLVATTFFLVSE